MSERRHLEFKPAEVLAAILSEKPKQNQLAAYCAFDSDRTIQLELNQYSESDRTQGHRLLRQASSLGVNLCAYGDARYPELLTEIYNPPVLLFYQGSLECLSKPCVALVGSRAADRAGADIAAGFSRELASAGVCVVSGLALGVDAAAHSGALSARVTGSTAAVLGNGLPQIYPRRNERLATEILDNGGCLISQFAPETPAFPANFLNRNRIIAGLSAGVLVVQADLRSGSLVTARYANEEGREVCAIPGALADARHRGTNALIRQGATLVTNVAELIDALPNLRVQLPTAEKSSAELPSTLSLLGDGAAHDVLELQRQSGITESDLLELELAGLIRRLPGNQIQRS